MGTYEYLPDWVMLSCFCRSVFICSVTYEQKITQPVQRFLINTFSKKILGEQINKYWDFYLGGHGEKADVEAGQSHLQAYQVIWNTRKLIRKRAPDMESDI